MADQNQENRKRVNGLEGRVEDIAALCDSYDWAEVFGEGGGGNTDGTVSAARPGSMVLLGSVSRTWVAEIYAMADGENDGDEWIGLFRLIDGRYLVASGSCDYTGWDCQAGNNLVVAETWAEALVFGLSAEQAARLNLGMIRATLEGGVA